MRVQIPPGGGRKPCCSSVSVKRRTRLDRQNILRSFISATHAAHRRADRGRFLRYLFGLAPRSHSSDVCGSVEKCSVKLHYLVEESPMSDFRPCLITIVLMWDGLAAGGFLVPRSCGCPCIACFRARGSCRPQAHSIYAFPPARASAANKISAGVVELKRVRPVNAYWTRSRARLGSMGRSRRGEARPPESAPQRSAPFTPRVQLNPRPERPIVACAASSRSRISSCSR